MNDRWDVWRVRYVRYAEITDMAAFMAGRYLPPELVARNLSWDDAQAGLALAARHGHGRDYCVKPHHG